MKKKFFMSFMIPLSLLYFGQKSDKANVSTPNQITNTR
jgi:hypothetical protein